MGKVKESVFIHDEMIVDASWEDEDSYAQLPEESKISKIHERLLDDAINAQIMGMFGYADYYNYKNGANRAECPKTPRLDGKHEFVNVGFTFIKEACKHCDCDKPKTMIQGELKIGKKYVRSDNGKEVQILAEKQGSSQGSLSEYEYYMLGSDGKMYNKDGTVTSYDDDDTWESRRNKPAQNWFLTEG